MGIRNSPHNYLWWWPDWGWTGCVWPCAHGKPNYGLWWRSHVSSAGKAVTVKVGCARGRGDQGEDIVPRNWMLKLYEGGALEWLEIGQKMTGDGENSKLELGIAQLWQRAGLARS